MKDIMESPKNLLQQSVPKRDIEERKALRELLAHSSKQDRTSSPFSRYLIIAVLGFILGTAATWFFVSPRGSDREERNENGTAAIEQNSSTKETSQRQENTDQQPAEMTPSATNASSNAISVDEQPAGSSVTVNMATFGVPGWVVIHEDKDGALGNIIGAARFDPGIHLGEVPLLRNTVSGGMYHAVLYTDDGDREFNQATDAIIKDADGKSIESTFSVK